MNEPHDDHMLPPGYRLEEFEIVRVLGEDGFGIAYLAFAHLRPAAFIPTQSVIKYVYSETVHSSRSFAGEGLGRWLAIQRPTLLFRTRGRTAKQNLSPL